MKIRSYIAAAAVAVASMAMADGDTSYLYWMADATELADVSYAKVHVYESDGTTSAGYLTVAQPDGSGSGESFSSTFGNVFLEQVAVIGSSQLGASYRFQLELFGTDDKVKWLSAQIAQSAAVIGTNWQALGGSPTTFEGFHVPEPTSGLLALLGFGLMALRRKQK